MTHRTSVPHKLNIVRSYRATRSPASKIKSATKPAARSNIELTTQRPRNVQNRPELAIGIITADRPGLPTICATISSLRAAGFTQTLHIFTEALTVSENALHNYDNNIRVFKDVPAGCVPNWRRAAHWLADNTTSPWIMIMQDDVIWCSGGADILTETLSVVDTGASSIKRNNLGVLSAYTSPAMLSAGTSGVGWLEARFYGKTKGLWGALALCFPRESLLSLLSNKRFVKYKETRALDYVIGDTLRNYSSPPLCVKIHAPSLTDHIGDKSTIYKAAAVRPKYMQKLRHGFRYTQDSTQWRQPHINGGK